MRRGRRPGLGLVLVAMLAACAGTGLDAIDPAIADRVRFCELVDEIAAVRPAVPDTELSEAKKQQKQRLVEQLADLVPEELTEDYLLRYWPSTEPLPAWVDTSGVRAQQAYDTWAAVIDGTC